MLKELSGQGNQVFYATHSTEFIDLAEYETLCIVKKPFVTGTKLNQAQSLTIEEGSKEQLKLLTEFDSKRNEVFFARKVLLVEGATEKYSLPYIFQQKGLNINEFGISITDVGGKGNLIFFAKISNLFLGVAKESVIVEGNLTYKG